MTKTLSEKMIHAKLIEDGFNENVFGVISASFENGNGSMNLTYVIAGYAEWYSDQQNAELIAENEQLKGQQQQMMEQLNNHLSK